jgi:hypothetical protein
VVTGDFDSADDGVMPDVDAEVLFWWLVWHGECLKIMI